MIEFKVCPKCRGDLYLREDIFGKYLSCLQCGYLRDVLESRLPARRESGARPDVGIEEKSKAA